MQSTVIRKGIVKKGRRYCILFFAFLAQAGPLLAQSISLSLKEAPIVRAFRKIEAQSDLYFIYSSEAIRRARPVSVELRGAGVEEALVRVFAGQPLSYRVEEGQVFVKAGAAVPQTAVVDVSGTVADEEGAPLQGVSVVVNGGGKGTVTDAAGQYFLAAVDEHAVLVFSFVGRESLQVPVKGRRTINVILKAVSKALDETIVQAYGTTTRRLNTGSISKLSADEIERQPVSNPIAALEGRIAGLQIGQGSGLPGSFYTIRLRGQNSIANGNDPLIIVDGVPFPSTTLNGTFGGGGGVANSPLNNIDPATIKSIEVLKDADATAIYGSKAANGVILITTKGGLAGKPQVDVGFYTGFGWVVNRLPLLNTAQYLAMRREAFENDGVQPTISNAKDLLLWDTTRFTNWPAVLIGNTMHVYDGKSSYSAGSQGLRFLVGMGYHKETTVLPGSFGEEKFSANFSVNHVSANARLSLSVSGSFLRNKNVLPQSDLTANINLPPDAPAIYDAEGNLNWENSSWVNPFSVLSKPFQTYTDNLLSHILVGYRLFRDLDFKTSVSVNRISQQEHIRNPMSSNNPAIVKTGSASFGSNLINTIIAEPQLNYKKQVLEGNLLLLAGYTMQVTNQYAIYQQGSGYTSDDLLHSLKAASNVTVSNETDTRYRYAGLFGRLKYDYKGTYLLTGTIRRDGSSRYGPDNRFANFWSLGGGWVFSNERFMHSMPFVSFAKVKASIGTTGNDQIGDYKYLDVYSPTTFPYLGVSGLQPLQLFNPGFGWERVVKRELGLEIGLLKDRSILTLNYYHNTTTNQLVLYGLSSVTGFSGVLQNLPARILNKGFEFELSTSVISKDNFAWRANFNLAIPKNKLTSFRDLERSSYATSYIVGRSLFISRRYKLTGVDPQTGVYTFDDVNKDGKISADKDLNTVVFTGQQYFGGFQNLLRYKGIHMSFLVQFVRQKNAVSYVSRFGRPGVMNNQPVFVLERWRSAGDKASVQRFSNSSSAGNTGFSRYLLSDGVYSHASFVRLKTLELGCDFNKDGDAAGTVFLQGQNLMTITEYKGLDPETKSVLPPISMVTLGFRFSL